MGFNLRFDQRLVDIEDVAQGRVPRLSKYKDSVLSRLRGINLITCAVIRY